MMSRKRGLAFVMRSQDARFSSRNTTAIVAPFSNARSDVTYTHVNQSLLNDADIDRIVIKFKYLWHDISLKTRSLSKYICIPISLCIPIYIDWVFNYCIIVKKYNKWTTENRILSKYRRTYHINEFNAQIIKPRNTFFIAWITLIFISQL